MATALRRTTPAIRSIRDISAMGASLSDEGRFEDDAPIDYPRGPDEHGLDGRRDFRRLAQLPQDVDQPSERADQVTLVPAEGLLHDRRPVIFSRGPAEDGGHEARRDTHGHGQVMVPLDFEHGVSHGFQLLELAPELGTLLQEEPRHRGIAGARLLDEAGAERGRLGERGVLEDAAVHHLRDEELIVVAEARDELPLGQELAILHGAESLEHGHHPAELLPVGVLEGVQHLALLAETPLEGLQALPGMIAPALAAPGTAMALDGGEGTFRALAPLPLDEVGDGESLELLGQAPRPPLPVARKMKRRRLPEDSLDIAFLHLDGGAMGQQHGDEHAVAPPVETADDPEGGAALASHQGQAPRLGLGHRAPVPAALSPRHPLLLDLGARHTIAAYPREITAGRREALPVLHGNLEARDLCLQSADLLQVLVLAERGLHRAPYRGHVLARGEQERHRAIAQLELAQHGLGRAIH